MVGSGEVASASSPGRRRSSSGPAGRLRTWSLVLLAVSLLATGRAAADVSLWPATVPSAFSGADLPSELGVKFRSDVAGSVTGIRFYKIPQNTGPHVGHLWSSDGTLLATATFTNETASGWQEATFSQPVAILPNTVYIASYHCPSGFYGFTQGYFQFPVDTPPLHAPASELSGGNGVFAYGEAGLFPSQTFNATNYWVDVLFDPTPPALVSIAVTPAATTIASNGQQQFVATGTFGAGAVADVTDQVTWDSSDENVATVDADGLATAEGAGTTDVSATLDAVTGSTPLTVLAPGAVAITTTQLPYGARGSAYSAPVTAVGGLLPYSWSIVGGALPAGLSLGAGTGVIMGTPSATGTANFTVRVGSGAAFATRNLSITVAQNEIAAENLLPGNPPSQWDIIGAGDPDLQGFATDISVDRGETVRFKIDTDASDYRLEIYRIGYYGGLGARRVAIRQPSVSLPQNQPPCLSAPTTGLVDCGNWVQSASWNVPATAVSGVYIAKLVREAPEDGRASHILFVVRDDDGGSDILMQTSDTTWQAYNQYGGNSLYAGQPVGRAFKVSYNRPFTTRCCLFPQPGSTRSFFFNAEYPMVRWLERNGYDVSYSTGVDADRRGEEILEHGTYMTVGQDEYWSGGQRDNVESARAAGVNLALVSGNAGFWKTRFEPSIDGTGTPYRTLVSYKETHANAKIDPLPGVWTGTWRDPRFGPHDGGRPENALNGTLFMVNGIRNDTPQVPAADGRMRFWRNTDIATLGAGQIALLPERTLGFEWDADVDNGSRPPGLVRLSTTTVSGLPLLQDFGSNYANGTATHHATLYRHASGALVFSAATVQWSWGLDAQHDLPGTPVDSRMQQAMVNLLADMGTQPGTLQAGLVPATESTDVTAPSATITSPGSGSNAAIGLPVTIAGTASDAHGQVGGVEVTTDGGITWHPATGRGAWTYQWTPSAGGTAQLRARAVDDSGNLGAASATVTVTVAPPVLQSIAVTPSSANVAVGGTQQFTATGTYVGGSTQDLTGQVSWASSNAGVATVNAAGLATALSAGDTNITATLGVISGGAAFTVVPPGALLITTATLPNAAQGSPYTAALTATGGTPPYSWSLASGQLPAGLTLASTGVISGTPTVLGVASFTVRVTAGAASTTRPLSITVSLPAQSVFPNSAVPPAINGPDQPVELGVKFRSDVAGFLTGIRFYKDALNTGVHVGNLWSSSGAPLATATFTGETASGWQQVTFSQPVAIEANTTYVASYHCPNGHYGFSSFLFSTAGVDAPPLHFLASPASGGNGVFTYAPVSAFPTSTFNDNYYWVDVVFQPAAPTAECSDGLDSDGDGLVDHPADPGCASPSDLSERSPTLACDDGADNDGDGRNDFDPATFANPLAGTGDQGCGSPAATREDPACQDGVDNDQQVGIDFDGGQSIHGACTGTPGGCPPGVSDPEGDGVANPDPQCVGKPHQNTESTSCGLGTELVLLLPALRGLRRRRAVAAATE